jgi:hypothetical protein
MALRNQLRAPGAFAGVDRMALSNADLRALTDLSTAVPNAESAAFIIRHFDQIVERGGEADGLLRHAAQYAAPEDLDALAGVVRKRFAKDLDLQLSLLDSIRAGLTQRGAMPSPAMVLWATELASQSLRPDKKAELAWVNIPLEGAPTANPWTYENRRGMDGAKLNLLSSLPRGEQLSGTLRSRPFSVPPKLSFYLCGHNGVPPAPSNDKNRVRLVAADDTHQVLAETLPPRNDRAEHVTWDLGAYAGRSAYIEVIDTDTGTAYAWLAFGKFSPDVVPMPRFSPSDAQRRQQDACTLAEAFKLKGLEPELARLLASDESNNETRIAAARALAACGSGAGIPLLAKILADPNRNEPLREQVAATLAPEEATSDYASDE